MKNSQSWMMYVSIAVVLALCALGYAARPTYTPAVESVSIEYKVDVPQAQVVESSPSVADETLTTIVESYVDISEDNNEAMIALATEDMRARENRQLVLAMAGLALLLFVLVGAIISMPFLQTLLLARSVRPETYTGEWKVQGQ